MLGSVSSLPFRVLETPSPSPGPSFPAAAAAGCLELKRRPFGRWGLEASVKPERRWLGIDWWGRGGGSSHVGELGCGVGARGPCGGVRRAATLWGWLLCTATGWGASPCTCSDVDDGGAAFSTLSSSELPLPPICDRVGSGRLAVSFLSISAAASGCWGSVARRRRRCRAP